MATPLTTVALGSVVLAPKGTWHKVVAGNATMVAAQATKAGAGMEQRG